MNCQNVRTAIDDSSSHEPFSATITTHLAFCQDCTEQAAQTSALFALLNDVPQVTAPNDFDFRLRARIAQARAAQVPRGGHGFFSELWKLSFSWGQVASTMAAVALVVAVSAVYLTRTDKPVAPSGTAVATADKPDKTVANPPVSVRGPSVKGNRPIEVAGFLKPDSASPKAGKFVAPVNIRNSGNNSQLTAAATVPKTAIEDVAAPVAGDSIPKALIQIGNRRLAVSDLSYGVQPTVAAVSAAPRASQVIF